MDIQGLGYVGIRAKSLEDWAGFGTKFLGMQLVDKSAKSLALRMDDRKQRVVVGRGRRRGRRLLRLGGCGRRRARAVRGAAGEGRACRSRAARARSPTNAASRT